MTRRLHLVCVMLLLAGLTLVSTPSFAVTQYVNDEHEVALRSGPSQTNRVIKMLSPGTEVRVLSTRNDWSKVRLLEGSQETRDGWVQVKDLTNDSPETMQIKGLELESGSLKETIKGLEKEKAEFAKREKDLTDKISKLETDYATLKNGSANYLKFKEEFDQTRAALASLQANNQALLQENDNLKLSEHIKWFLFGGAVLFAGWLLGFFAGKLQRRRRPQYR